jgi:acyl-CoA synthetase (AMP-forming)/AMP-acid ligase II
VPPNFTSITLVSSDRYNNRTASERILRRNTPLKRNVLSFPEILLQRARRQPAKIAYRFCRGQALSFETLTFHALWERAAGLAYLMQYHGLSNRRALLVCKSQKNFVVAFFACLLAGTVAVPTAPPRRQSLLSRLALIVHDAQAQAIIFDCDELQQADLESSQGALVKLDMRSCVRSEDQAGLSARWAPRFPTDEAPALLQYTSGSTGNPKGVVVSHANLMHNCAAIQDAMAVSEESSVFGALPLFHDMGLIGGVLQSMHSGCVTSFLSPAEFVQYPERWLQIVSAFQVTISGGPNFMYELAARAIKSEQVRDIDLSGWRVAFCGADLFEPLRFLDSHSALRRLALSQKPFILATGWPSRHCSSPVAMLEPSRGSVTGKAQKSSDAACPGMIRILKLLTLTLSIGFLKIVLVKSGSRGAA